MPEDKVKPEDLVQDISHKLHGCPLYKLLCQNLADQDIVKPKEYLNAASQNFALTLIITWIITLLVNPEAVKDHPMKQVIGADNPCFGWDYPPASYVAMFMNSANVYFTWRWAYLENARTKLQSSVGGPSCVQRFAYFTTWALAIASNLWLLLWIVGPAQSHYTEAKSEVHWDPETGSSPKLTFWLAHVALFVIYALCSYMAVLANYLEVKFSPRSTVLETKHGAFIIVYGASLVFLLVTYGYCIWEFEHGHPAKLPAPVMYAAVLIWMACMGNGSNYTAPEIPLKISVVMATDSA